MDSKEWLEGVKKLEAVCPYCNKLLPGNISPIGHLFNCAAYKQRHQIETFTREEAPGWVFLELIDDEEEESVK